MSPDDLAFLDELARARCGIGLRGDKAYFAENRLGALARREGMTSVADLLARLRGGGEETLSTAAAEALAVTDTAFFRDGATFAELGRHVLPTLAGPEGERIVQVWSAGCSTGQEAYSLAMLAEESTPSVRLEMIATDLSERVLEKAHAGLYTQFEVQRGLPIRLLLKHFDKTGEMWSVSPRLRAAIRWRRLNLVEDRRSVRRFDLILCRNVLSHFIAPARERVMASLIAALSSTGFLVLGAGEAGPEGFEETAAGSGVFRLPRELGRAAA